MQQQTEPPLHIGVDFDGVLFDHVPVVLRGFRDAFGIDLGEEGFRHWDYFRYQALHDKDVTVAAVRRLLQAIETDPHVHAAPLRDPTARLVMQEWMHDGHRVDVVTARDPISEAVTRAFLAHNRVPYHDLRMAAGIKTGYDLLVDDAPHNVLMAAAAGGQAMLMDHPYNRDVPCLGNPRRVADWTEVGRFARTAAPMPFASR